MNVQTTLVPGYWWYPAGHKIKRKLGRNIKDAVLRCVRNNPGITSDRVPSLTGSTLNYAREVLRILVVEGLVTKKYEGHSVVTYWSAL